MTPLPVKEIVAAIEQRDDLILELRRQVAARDVEIVRLKQGNLTAEEREPPLTPQEHELAVFL